jgi:hypothetical protein
MQMFISLQRGITLWVQAKTGLTGILVAWLGVAAFAAIIMFVFLCVTGCAWLSIELGPVLGPLAMAGVFLMITTVAVLASVLLRRRTKQRPILEQTKRAPPAVALANPAVLNIAMEAARTLGWRRLVPIALLGILAAQLAQAPHSSAAPAPLRL